MVAALLACVVALAACTKATDRSRIDSVVRDYLDAFAARDAERLASDLTSTCHASASKLQAEFAPFRDEHLAVHVDAVEIADLTDTTANATAKGTLTVGSHTFPLSGINRQQAFHMIKEAGDWKIANCPAGASG